MITEHSTRASDGTELFFTVEGGPADAPVSGVDLLLCDGIGCDGFIWRYLRPLLVSRGRVIHLHMRGHGRSAPPSDPGAVEIATLADDWARVLAVTGVRRAVALGHSMGVQVALETWHRCPEQLAGLVLLCGSFENPVSTFHNRRVLERALPALRGASRFGGRPLKAVWRRLVTLPVAYHVARMTELHPDLTRREDFEPYLEHLSEMDPALFFRMLSAAAQHTAAPYLARLDVPVLVVAGVDDHFTPAHRSEEMVRLLPDAELLLVEEGTHTAPIEQPTLVGVRVMTFLEQRVGAA